MIFIGYCNSYFVDKSNSSHHISIEKTGVEYVFGEVIDKNGYGKNTNYTFEIKKLKKTNHPGWKTEFGKILLRCQDCDTLFIGANLVIKADLSKINAPDEYYLPDFKKYYNNRGIYFQQYLTEKSVVQAGYNQNLYFLASAINSYFEKQLKEALTPENFAIANALILGNKSDLNEYTRDLYARSGIMHILAVSGLHVGIVYLILYSLFGFLKGNRKGDILFVFLTITLLWTYAFITGLSISVVRASIMFSLFLASPLVKRKNYSMNAAAVSATAMLIINPNALYDISFQLSYAAVFSIILFYHSFFNLFIPKNAVIRFFWQITCVSIAVQIGTFPVTIYYFHHFQPYFIIYNLFAIPFAFVTLLLGLSFLIATPAKFITDILSFFLNYIISTFNIIIAKLYEWFPGTSYLQLETFEVFILVLVTFTFFGLVYRKKLSYMVFLSFCLLIITSFHSFKNFQLAQQVGFKSFESHSKGNLIYAGNKYHLIDLPDSVISNYEIGAFLNFNHLTHNETTLYCKENDDYKLLVSHQKTILILKKTNFILRDGIRFDYIILPENSPRYVKNHYARFAKKLLSK